MMPPNSTTIPAAIAERASSQPDAVVMTFLSPGQDAHRLTYGQIHAEASAIAGQLQAAGIRPGDVVVLAAEHNATLVNLFVAILYAGATPTIAAYPTAFNQATLYQQRLLHLVQSSQARAILVGTTKALPEVWAELSAPLQVANCAVLHVEALTAAPLPPLGQTPGSAPTGTHHPSPATGQAGGPGQAPVPVPPPGASRLSSLAAAFIQFSSGTTGAPRGAIVSHAAALHHVQMLLIGLNMGPGEVLVGWAPFYHDLGLVGYLLLPLVSGVPAITLAPDYWVRRPQALLRAIHDYRGTTCIMPNFGFAHSTRNVRQQDCEGLDLSCVRHLVAGAEVVLPETLLAFADRFRHTGLDPAVLKVGYGMAETVLVTTITPVPTATRHPSPATGQTQGSAPTATRHSSPATVHAPALRIDSIDRSALLHERRAVATVDGNALLVASCGVPLPGVAIAVISDEGKLLPEREVGEILISSPTLFDGYWSEGRLQRPNLTVPGLEGSQFRSGDLGYVAEGELYVIDRKKDLIITAGKNIYPETIEQIGLGVVGAAGGRAAAFGVRSLEMGTELPVLVCELRGQMSDEEAAALAAAIRREVREQTETDLADVRLLRRGWLEITTSGKVARSATREKYLAAGFRPEPPGLQLLRAAGTDAELLEQALTTLFAGLLGSPTVAIDADLVDLGLDSLTFVNAILTIEQTTGRELPIQEVAPEPTIAHFVRLLAPVGTAGGTRGQAAPHQKRARNKGAGSPDPALPGKRKRTGAVRIRYERFIEDGPTWTVFTLPYRLGVGLQRRWLRLPAVRARYQRQIDLLWRWIDLVGGVDDPDQLIEQSLKANTWLSWRRQALAQPQALSKCVRVTGGENIRQNREAGRSLIVVLSHVALPEELITQADPLLTDAVLMRSRPDGRKSPSRNVLQQTYRGQLSLERGGVLFLAGDAIRLQGHHALWAPFFGKERRFQYGYAEMAQRSGADIVPVFVNLSPSGQIVIEFLPPLAVAAGSGPTAEMLARAYAALYVQRLPAHLGVLRWNHLHRVLHKAVREPLS